MEDKNVRKKFDNALAAFIERMKTDRNVLAVFVGGSYTNGQVWEYSDLDLTVVTNDDNEGDLYLPAREGDVLLNIDIVSRATYRKEQQRFIHGSVLHHLLATSKLVYCNDQTIIENQRNLKNIADKDKSLITMYYSEFLVGCLLKARKTLMIEDNPEKCFFWIFDAFINLAKAVLIFNNEIPGRDVIEQLRKKNYDQLFDHYTSFVNKGCERNNLGMILAMLENYLIQHRSLYYEPLFTYLANAAGERLAVEADAHFKKELGIVSFFTLIESYIWLAQHGDLILGVSPKRIATKSKSTVDQMTLFYSGGKL